MNRKNKKGTKNLTVRLDIESKVISSKLELAFWKNKDFLFGKRKFISFLSIISIRDGIILGLVYTGNLD
jgi:hypothetical protein